MVPLDFFQIDDGDSNRNAAVDGLQRRRLVRRAAGNRAVRHRIEGDQLFVKNSWSSIVPVSSIERTANELGFVMS